MRDTQYWLTIAIELLKSEYPPEQWVDYHIPEMEAAVAAANKRPQIAKLQEALTDVLMTWEAEFPYDDNCVIVKRAIALLGDAND